MQPAVTTRWIGGPAWDLGFFWLSSAACVAVGSLLIVRPEWVVPMWWLWIALVDGPHLISTYLRTYLDPLERAKHRQLYLSSLLWLLPGPLAWAAMLATGRREPFDLFLLFASLWAFHHAVRQHYGILAVYQRLGGTGPALRRLDWHFVHDVPWALYLLFLVTHPWSRKALLLPMEMAAPERAAAVAAGALCAAAVLAYALGTGVRAARGLSVRPALFALLPVVAMFAFSFFVAGRFEPVIPEPRDPEQYFLVVGFIGGAVHGVQYLGMIFATNRRRYTRSDATTLAARLGRSPWLGYLACALASCTAYVLVNLLRGNSPGAWLPVEHPAAQLVLALYWGAFFHHYYLDQKMWHPQYDPALQIDLGLKEAP
jgi:hypothetical protein